MEIITIQWRSIFCHILYELKKLMLEIFLMFFIYTFLHLLMSFFMYYISFILYLCIFGVHFCVVKHLFLYFFLILLLHIAFPYVATFFSHSSIFLYIPSHLCLICILWGLYLCLEASKFVLYFHIFHLHKSSFLSCLSTFVSLRDKFSIMV